MSGNLLQTRVVSTSIFHWQVAVCNLASLALNRFVTSEGKYDFQRLFEVTKVCVHICEQSESVVIFLSCFSWQVVTRNLNRIIDVNYYPVPEVPIIVLVLLPVSSSKKTKKNEVLVEFEQILSPLSSSGWIFQQTSQTHWHWGSGFSWCFHSDAIPFWEPWGTRPEQEDLWDHLLWCPYSILRACQTWWSIWYLRGITSQQGRKCTGNYFTDLHLGSLFSPLSSCLSPPFFPSLFPSFYSWVDLTHSLRSCNMICGKWLLLISGTGANSRLTLPSKHKW